MLVLGPVIGAIGVLAPVFVALASPIGIVRLESRNLSGSSCEGLGSSKVTTSPPSNHGRMIELKLSSNSSRAWSWSS